MPTLQRCQPNRYRTEGSGKKHGIGRSKHPNSRKGNANLKPLPKGVSGNPGGLPGRDLSALYARRFFEEHPEGISYSMAEDLKGFNAYSFSVLADRGYGKVKERHELAGADGKPLEVTIRFVLSREAVESSRIKSLKRLRAPRNVFSVFHIR